MSEAEEALLDALKQLLPVQFEEVVFRFANAQRSEIRREPQALAALDLLTIARQRPDGVVTLAALVEKVIAGPTNDDRPPPPPPPPPPPRPEPPHVQDTVDALRAIFAARDRVRRRFTDIGFGDTPESIADQIVRKRTAIEVLAAIECVLQLLCNDPDATADDRRAVMAIFERGVRYAVDWVEVVHRLRNALKPGATAGRCNAIEVPVCREPIAELVLAGVDDRAPAFDVTDNAPLVAVTHVAEAAMLRAPMVQNRRRFEEIMVKHLADGVFRDNADLERARREPGSAASLAAVEGVLRKHGYPRFGGKPRPYYVSFGKGEGDLWQLVCEAPDASTKLPSLGLVRLIGAESADEAEMIEFIKTILRRYDTP